MKRLSVILSLLLMLAPSLASAQSTDAKREKLRKEIEMLDRQLKDNRQRSASALSTLNLTRKKVSSRKKLVASSDKEIRALNERIYQKQREINRLQERLDTMTVYYSKLVRNAYINRDARVWYMYILSSGSLGQGIRRYSYLKNLSVQMNTQAEKLLATKNELSDEKAKMEVLRSEAQVLKRKRQKELDELKKEETESQKVVASLKKDKAKYQKQLASKKREVEALNRAVDKIISTNASGKKSRQVDVKLSAEFAANRGRLPWPVEGVVVETFGEHFHPVYKNVKLPFNNGVGISASPGAKVKAVFNGVVKQIIVMPGYNQCILVEHGEYYTFYCKMGSVKVRAGDKVKTGQLLGTVDTISGETQLHFQLWEGRKPRDPEDWLY